METSHYVMIISHHISHCLYIPLYYYSCLYISFIYLIIYIYTPLNRWYVHHSQSWVVNMALFSPHDIFIHFNALGHLWRSAESPAISKSKRGRLRQRGLSPLKGRKALMPEASWEIGSLAIYQIDFRSSDWWWNLVIGDSQKPWQGGSAGYKLVGKNPHFFSSYCPRKDW